MAGILHWEKRKQRAAFMSSCHAFDGVISM